MPAIISLNKEISAVFLRSILYLFSILWTCIHYSSTLYLSSICFYSSLFICTIIAIKFISVVSKASSSLCVSNNFLIFALASCNSVSGTIIFVAKFIIYVKIELAQKLQGLYSFKIYAHCWHCRYNQSLFNDIYNGQMISLDNDFMLKKLDEVMYLFYCLHKSSYFKFY